MSKCHIVGNLMHWLIVNESLLQNPSDHPYFNQDQTKMDSVWENIIISWRYLEKIRNSGLYLSLQGEKYTGIISFRQRKQIWL